ncbi:SDR family NAD(P)-dependent oxidoreductase [Legionella tunisiensis]|uniref:SDR family NAD(P)-dependent oxidoreductase n=1 Tax=Legionella tunisiensis TaxID=1034944 RepID=UPI0002E3052F|nr:SDR family NAD(P)-dependent oxidoreductase [Legionella tunisiensis]
MQQKIILITGCSTGIGHDAALTLAKRGHRVIASCRKAEDVQKLATLGLETIQMDVDDTTSIETAFAEVLTKTGGHIDVLINNAGYGQVGALEDVPRTALRSQFETNVFGLLDLTRLAIPLMRRQGQGRIINISSILGVISLPFRGAYNASKYAVEGLSDTLRLELQSSGIRVITVEPGPIQSQFRDNCIDNSLQKIDSEHSYFKAHYQQMLGHFRQQKADSPFTQGTDTVIKKLIHAIEAKNPRAKYRVTLPAHLFVWLKRLLSVKMLDRFLIYLSRKELGPN